jgi:hypothetical protein
VMSREIVVSRETGLGREAGLSRGGTPAGDMLAGTG